MYAKQYQIQITYLSGVKKYFKFEGDYEEALTYAYGNGYDDYGKKMKNGKM